MHNFVLGCVSRYSTLCS